MAAGEYACAGCVIGIGYDGELAVERGLVRPEDRAADTTDNRVATIRREALRLLQRAGRCCDVVMTSTSSRSLRAIALESLAMIVLPRSECPPALRLLQAAIVLPKLPHMGYRLYASARTNPMAGALEELLVSYCRRGATRI